MAGPAYGTGLRMAMTPAFVTSRFGQCHEVKNLFVGGTSVRAAATGTTLSILAFSLRTSEHLVKQMRDGEL
jgi:choline dehydrogenase-like flavoprotein